MIRFGGDTAYKTRKQKDIAIAFHWISFGDYTNEPCMVLFPVRARMGAGAYVLPLHKAYTFATSEGFASKTLVESATKAANVMAMDVTSMTVHNIADVILDNLPDLVQMPPMPKDWANMVRQSRKGELTVKVGGDKVLQKEIDLDG